MKQILSLMAVMTKVNAHKDCSSELDDVAHVNAFVDSLSDDDIGQLIGDGVNKAPIKPFKPIR